ncbi:MAG: hypothetical protein IJC99_05690, partial [Clostridia bacterium]|nr:hypothetical protein [Clostridia bacterium]
ILRAARRTGSRRAQTYLSYVKVVCVEQRRCAQNYQPNYARRISLGAEILRAARRTGSRRAQTYLSYVKVVCVEQRRCAQNYQPNYAPR